MDGGEQENHPRSQDRSNESSTANSRRGSTIALSESKPPKEKHRVRFNSGERSDDGPLHRPAIGSSGRSPSPARTRTGTDSPGIIHGTKPLRPSRPLHCNSGSFGSGPLYVDASTSITPSPIRSPVTRSRPAIFSLSSNSSELDDVSEEHQTSEEDKADHDVEPVDEKEASSQTARRAAERLSRSLTGHRRTRSLPTSKTSSPDRSPQRSAPPSPTLEHEVGLPAGITSLPMKHFVRRKKYGIEDDTESEEEEEEEEDNDPNTYLSHSKLARLKAAAKRLVRAHTSPRHDALFRVRATDSGLQSGQITPIEDRGDPDNYFPVPRQYRGGILGSLLRLYNEQGFGAAVGNHPSGPGVNPRSYRQHRRSSSDSLVHGGFTPQESPSGTPARQHSPPSSGTTTPKQQKSPKWYHKDSNAGSTTSLAELVQSSLSLAQPGGSPATGQRPPMKHKSRSGSAIDTVLGRRKRQRGEETIHIQFHIQETLARQRYLLKLCRALMSYGAPTHRLEEYMRMSARVLEIEGQFLYMPGCMIISFDDASTHTTEVKLVRTQQAVDLGKLRDVHDIYKEVVHDRTGVSQASDRLDALVHRKPKFGPWVLVAVYGLASAFVGPFAFQARLIDMPIAFLLGCLLGFMQLILAPRSELYANVFEISAALLTSFLARAFGSIAGGELFCFSALAQSSIALILPGYTVLCGALELQSRNVVAGSVRMVYAIIYSLFLGFGITIGTSFYGGIDRAATSAVECARPLEGLWPLIFVPPFTLCLIVINQGKWKQVPVMLVIAFAGYVVNHFSALRFSSNVQVSNTLGALAIGVLGNLYSRFWHGLSAAALIPAIFVQVPSGLAASGSLISGITSANQITNGTNSTTAGGITTVANGTQAGSSSINVNSLVFNVGYSMIQVAIGITVGLFLSSLLVYPFGKRRSGLFSF